MQGYNSLRTDFFDEHKEKSPNNTALENGVQNHPVPCQITGSMDLDYDVGSPASLAKAYMASKPSIASPSSIALQIQSRLKDFISLNYQSTPADSPSMSVCPWLSSHIGNVENGLTSARYHGRSALARTPYSRVQPNSSLKGVGLKHDAYHNTSASRQRAHKRKNSFLQNNIGSVGPLRRIRYKPYLWSSRGLISQGSGSTLSMSGTRSGTDGTHSPPIVHNEANAIPSTSFPPPPPPPPPPPLKSREAASKILQHLDEALLSSEHVESSRFFESPGDISKVDKLLDTSSPAPQNTHNKQDKIENSPSNLIVPFADPSSSKMNNFSGATQVDSSVLKPVTPPSQIRHAFHMSVPEVYLEFDDDNCANGTRSSVSPKGKDILDANPVYLEFDDDNCANGTGSSVSPKGKDILDANPVYLEFDDDNCANGTGSSVSPKGKDILDANPVDPKTTDSELRAQEKRSTLDGKSSRGNGVWSPIEPKASIPISDGDKFASGEPAADISKAVSNKLLDSLQVPCTTSSMGDLVPVSEEDKVSFLEPAGLSSNVFCNKNMDASQVTFGTPSITASAGVSLESKLANISSSSTAFAGPTYCSPKVPELEEAYGKNNSFFGTFGRSSGTAVGSVSTPTSTYGHFSFGSTVNNSNPANGPLPTSSSFSGGQSTIASSSSLFSSTSASAAASALPVFNGPGTAFQFSSAPSYYSKMNMEDSVEEDGVQGYTNTAPPEFPQQPVTPILNFANPFQVGGEQNFFAATPAQPFCNGPDPGFQVCSAPNNSERNMEDVMEVDGVQGSAVAADVMEVDGVQGSAIAADVMEVDEIQSSTIAAPPVFPQQPVTPIPNFGFSSIAAPPVFPQQPVTPIPNFGFSSIAAPPLFPQQPVTPLPNFAFSSLTNLPGVAIPFQFGGQQNFPAYHNASPFQPPASSDLQYFIYRPMFHRN